MLLYHVIEGVVITTLMYIVMYKCTLTCLVIVACYYVNITVHLKPA